VRVGNEDVTTDDQRLAKLKAGHWRIIEKEIRGLARHGSRSN
jgi:hypothetical protein